MQGSTSQVPPDFTSRSTPQVLFSIDLFGQNAMPSFTTNDHFQTTIPQQDINQHTSSFQGPMIGPTPQVPQTFMQQESSQQVHPQGSFLHNVAQQDPNQPRITNQVPFQQSSFQPQEFSQQGTVP